MADVSVSVVVVGSGISGLATAHHLRRTLGEAVDVTVLEQGEEAGGKIRTRQLAGLAVDVGPDAFLSRAPQLKALVADLGLDGDVEGPAASGAFIWSRGKLRPLPSGATFGLPEKVLPLVRSGLINWPGALRAAMDVVLPRSTRPADPSVEELIRPRLGTEVFERMVEPLLGGVHAGSAKVLSARSTVPEIVGMIGDRRSAIIATRGRKKPPPPQPGVKPLPPLVSIRGGLSRLTAALVESIGPERIHTQTRVTELRRTADGRWGVLTNSGVRQADHVVLAIPGYAAAELLEPLSPAAAGDLRGIPYVDVAGILLAFRKDQIPTLPHGTGYLVPPVEGDLVVGSTWLTSKWPHLQNDDVVIIRTLVGRYGDTRFVDMDDATVTTEVRAALERVLGITAEPVEGFVQRWPAAMPQYVVGHADRLQRIDAAVAQWPGLHLTGAAYRGVGLAGCVAQAEALAGAIAESARAPRDS